MASHIDLVKALWSVFLPQIRSGMPVYFTYHRDVLIKVFETNGLGTQDPLSIVSNAACEYFEIEDNVAIVDSKAFLPIFDVFSPIIILVVQQILVVEEMVKDRDGFSEDAYFPRLRRAMSKYLVEERIQPFGTSDEFEAIWRRFQFEIFKAGGNQRSITFSSGSHSNRNKSYPLSQALLSQEDIFKLVRLIGKDRIFSLKTPQLALEVKQIKGRLTRRGQKTLAVPFLKDRVYQQILSYRDSKFPEIDVIETKTEGEGKVFVHVYKDQVDLFTEEFRLGFFDESGSRIPDTNCRSKFRLLLRENKCLFLHESVLGDAWVTSSQTTEICRGQSIVIVSESSGKEFAETLLKRSFPDVKLLKEWIVIDSFQDIYIQLLEDLPGSTIPFRVFDGKNQHTVAEVTKRSIVWHGGFCIDDKTNKFLRRYMPSGMIVHNQLTPLKGPVKINGRISTFELFLNSIQGLQTDETFEVELDSGVKGKLSVAVKKNIEEEKQGYRITKFNKISALVEEIPLSMRSVQGFSIEPNNQVSNLGISDLVSLVQVKSDWVSVDASKISVIKNAIRNAQISAILKKIIIENIERDKTLPPRLKIL